MGTHKQESSMGWLTSILCVGLVVAIYSVHVPNGWQQVLGEEVHEEQEEGGKQEGEALKFSLEKMIEMGSKYLGQDGVEKILNGDFSQVEKIGKKLFGGKMEEGSEFINNLLKSVPKETQETLGKKMEEGSEFFNDLLKLVPEGTLGKTMEEGSEFINNLLQSVPEGTVGNQDSDSGSTGENENNLGHKKLVNPEDSSNIDEN